MTTSTPLRSAARPRTLDDETLCAAFQRTADECPDDVALAEELATKGVGLFVAPDVIENEVVARKQLRVAGRAPDLRQRFYIISLERKIQQGNERVAELEHLRQDVKCAVALAKGEELVWVVELARAGFTSLRVARAVEPGVGDCG